MIKYELDAVAKFHNAFGIESAQNPTVNVTKETILLRYNLMKEENEEYLEAAKNKDLVEVADALGDMLYILCGTIITHGMQDVIDEFINTVISLKEGGDVNYISFGNYCQIK